MTEILKHLDFTVHSNANRKMELREKMVNFFKKSGLLFQEQEGKFSTPFFCLNSYDMQGIFTYQIQQNLISLHLKILDDRGLQIKSVSQHQKTACIRYCNKINMSAEVISLKVNPLSGQIKTSMQFLLSEQPNSNFEETLYEMYRLFSQSQKMLQKLFEQMEIIHFSKNDFLLKFTSALQICKLFPGRIEKQSQQIESMPQCEHETFFINPSPEVVDTFCSQSWNFYRFSNSFTKRIQQKMACSPLKVKKSNWNYVHLLENAQLNAIKKQIVLNMSKTRFNPKIFLKAFQGKFQCIESYINLEFIPKSVKLIEEDYRISEQMGKLNYYSFIHEYVFTKSYSLLNKRYVIRKKQQPYMKLSDYMKKNKLTMSYLTKLGLCCSLITIGSICKKQIKKFSPSFELRNINVFNLNDLKLDCLDSNTKEYEAKISQSCVQILFEHRHQSLRRKMEISLLTTTWYNQIREVDGGFAKLEGPSPVICCLKQVLFQNLYSSQMEKESRSYSIEQMLFIFALILKKMDEIYSNFASNSVQNFEEP